MDLTPAECRVLGCLIESSVADPEGYPPTLNALRLACNQPTKREPVVAYDDRTVEDTLLALKSKGLARFVPPVRGDRLARYGHRADERWRMGPEELAVLAVLLLGGPQTVTEVRARAQRLHELGGVTEVDAVLDTLAARTPKPLAARIPGHEGASETRWVQVLTGPPRVDDDAGPDNRHPTPTRVGGSVSAPTELAASYAELVQRVADLEQRLAASLERALPPAGWRSAPIPPPPPPPSYDDESRRSQPGLGPAPVDRDERALPAAGERERRAVRDFADRVDDIERRLARIEAELGALR
jgi:uncharacterized protein